MNVTKKMLEAAGDALGYEIDASRVRTAFDEQEASLDAEQATVKLKRLEDQFAARGGRGVDLAEDIDNLRIFLACYDHVGEDEPKQEHTVTLLVKAPAHLSFGEVRLLVEKLIEVGQSDAAETVEECDDDEGEAASALSLDICVRNL